MNDRIIQTRTVTITLREDGILQVHALPGFDQGENDARENLDACRHLVEGKKVPVLVNTILQGTLDRQARNAYATGSDFALAQAILVNSAFTRIAANVFIRVAHPVHPTKMFTSEDEAIQWLKGFLT